MSSIISFGGARVSGMRKIATSYAALGVGLAIAFSFGLTAIAGMVGQPLAEVQNLTEPEFPEEAMKIAPSQEMVGSAADESAPVESPQPPGEGSTGEEMPPSAVEARYLAAEPAGSPLEGLSVVVPYIAAAIAGSIVFVVTRKRVG